MCWKVRHPEDAFSDVFWLDRIGTAIQVVIGFLVAAGTNQGKFAFAQTRLDRSYTNTRARKITANTQRELLNKGLGRTVNIAPG